MSKNAHQKLEWISARSEKSLNLLRESMEQKNVEQVIRSSQFLVNFRLSQGTLNWRLRIDPTQYFKEVFSIIENVTLLFSEVRVEINVSKIFPLHELAFFAFLIGHPWRPVDLANEVRETVASAFLGNVLLGYNHIDDWRIHSAALPQSNKYELAKQTNDLYAALLAGEIRDQEGVEIGEKLWKSRKSDFYFDVHLGGFGSDNDHMLDYQLAAILKKIGSTVPTVHAWRW